ncbi:entericidin EcnA/B family protein [Celeribacter arenosi]
MKRAAVFLLILSLSACGTVAGVGEDIQTGARTVQGWL